MTDPIYARIGAALRRRRDEVGMTQSALAQHLGLSRTSVTNIERGRQPMLVHQLLVASRVLKLDPGGLLVEAALPVQPPEAEATEHFKSLLAKLKPVGTGRL